MKTIKEFDRIKLNALLVINHTLLVVQLEISFGKIFSK